MGGLEMTNVVIIILVLICVFALLSACCRGLRHAYEDHATSEELARRRALFMSRTAQAPTTRNGRPSQNMRAVRVTTISHEGDSIAMGVYEIQVPRRPQHTRQTGQVPANLFGTSASSSAPRLAPAAPRSQYKDPPPPPFSTAYQVSTPVNTTTTVIDMDAPPPTYDEYLQIHQLGNQDQDAKKDETTGPTRY